MRAPASDMECILEVMEGAADSHGDGGVLIFSLASWNTLHRLLRNKMSLSARDSVCSRSIINRGGRDLRRRSGWTCRLDDFARQAPIACMHLTLS